MDHGSSDRVPASLLILFASVVFTLITFATFKFLWEIPISIYLLIAVLGLQCASLLLGSSKILTQLGAASLSALIAVTAGIGAVFLLFPPLLEPRIAGIAGGVSALVFIMASFVAASREDPLPSSAPEPLILDNFEDDPTAELIKYGEVQAPDATEGDDLPLTDRSWNEVAPREQSTFNGEEFFPVDEKDISEFDETFEDMVHGVEIDSKLDAPMPGTKDSLRGRLTKQTGEAPDPGSAVGSQTEHDPSGDLIIPGGWVEETARVMAYDTHERLPGRKYGGKTANEKDREEKQTAGRLSDFNLRTRYKVLDGLSGEHYGTYYGDEGYSTLDLVSLTGLIGSRLAVGELKIVKLDWSNFDEIEVHIQVEEILPIDLDNNVEENADGSDMLNEQNGSEIEVLPDKQLSEELIREELSSTVNHPGLRYTIYDRRTIQPMAEYVPEGGHSRIDRLTLYRMFPEYDFKTFEIDSIRWEADEVRIFIKGEKKSPKSKIQGPKEDHKQRDLPDDS